ncbi:MAG: hypothetical protein EA366_14845 [Spirulina sp. DLM2.Bin59]|nr:MAG: hypothetical protein EA366_14845 [Spirulina sp. DLM2.Bin59]
MHNSSNKVLQDNVLRFIKFYANVYNKPIYSSIKTWINELNLNEPPDGFHPGYYRFLYSRILLVETITNIIIDGQLNGYNSRFKRGGDPITNLHEDTALREILSSLTIKVSDLTVEEKYSIAYLFEQTVKNLLESGHDEYKSVDNPLFNAVRRKWYKEFDQKIIENAIYVSDEFLLLGESPQEYTYKCKWVWLPQPVRYGQSNDVLSKKLQRNYYLGFFLIFSKKANLDKSEDTQKAYFQKEPFWMEFRFYAIGEVVRSENDVWRFNVKPEYIYDSPLGTSRKTERLGASIHNGFVQAIHIHLLQKCGHSLRLCENRRHQFDRVGYCKYIRGDQAIAKDLQQCLSKIQKDCWQQSGAMQVINKITETM